MDNLEVFAVAGTAFLIIITIFFVRFVMAYRKRQNQFSLEKKIEQQKHEQTVLQTQVEIREEVLQHVSRELHDNIGQLTALTKINLHSLSHHITPDAQPRLNEALATVDMLFNEIKSLSHSLNAYQGLDGGLRNSMLRELERIRKTGLLTVRWDSDERAWPILHQNKIIIFRIFQEAISNVLQHAQASELFVITRVTDDTAYLMIEDNGVGFKVENASGKNGAGLANLKKRANSIDAELLLNTSPGEGTKIILQVPIMKTL